MPFSTQRMADAWHACSADPCAKNVLAFARLMALHRYNPQWPCHAWFQSDEWQQSPWKARWLSALLNSLRTSGVEAQISDSPLFSRCVSVARWPEQQTSLKNIVFADAWCPLEWWTLGRWLDQSGKDISTMPFFVAQWNPIWALAAPTHMHLGWQIGLQALHAQVSTIGQDPNMLESIDGSQCWPLETS